MEITWQLSPPRLPPCRLLPFFHVWKNRRPSRDWRPAKWQDCQSSFEQAEASQVSQNHSALISLFLFTSQNVLLPLIALVSAAGTGNPLLPLLVCFPCLPPTSVFSQTRRLLAFLHPFCRISVSASVAWAQPTNLPTASFCRRHKVDIFTHRPTELIHKQTKVKEGGDEEMSASQSNNPPARLPAKHSLFFSPLLACKAHLLEAALDAISNSIPFLNLPESF